MDAGEWKSCGCTFLYQSVIKQKKKKTREESSRDDKFMSTSKTIPCSASVFFYWRNLTKE